MSATEIPTPTAIVAECLRRAEGNRARALTQAVAAAARYWDMVARAVTREAAGDYFARAMANEEAARRLRPAIYR